MPMDNTRGYGCISRNFPGTRKGIVDKGEAEAGEEKLKMKEINAGVGI